MDDQLTTQINMSNINAQVDGNTYESESESRESVTLTQTSFTYQSPFMGKMEEQSVGGNPRYVIYNICIFLLCLCLEILFYVKSLGMGRCSKMVEFNRFINVNSSIC